MAVLLLGVVPAGQALAATGMERAILSTAEPAHESGLSGTALECSDAGSNETSPLDHPAEPQECALLAHFVMPAPVEPLERPGMNGLQVPSPANVRLERPPSTR